MGTHSVWYSTSHDAHFIDPPPTPLPHAPHCVCVADRAGRALDGALNGALDGALDGTSTRTLVARSDNSAAAASASADAAPDVVADADIATGSAVFEGLAVRGRLCCGRLASPDRSCRGSRPSGPLLAASRCRLRMSCVL